MSSRTFSPDALRVAVKQVLPPDQRERTQVDVNRSASRDTVEVRMHRRGHHAMVEISGQMMMDVRNNGELVLRNIQNLSRELPPALQPVALLYDREGRFVQAMSGEGYGNAIIIPGRLRRRVFNRVSGMYERGDNQPAVLVYQEGWEHGTGGLRREGSQQRAWRAPDVDEIEREYSFEGIDRSYTEPVGERVLHPRPPRSDGVIHLARFGEAVAGGRALAAYYALSNVGKTMALVMEDGTAKRGALLELDDTPTGPAPGDQSDTGARGSLLELE